MKKYSLLINMSFLGIIFFWGRLWAQGNADKPVIIDSNTVVIDLDQKPQYTYEAKLLAKLAVGSRPGEIGVKEVDEVPSGPETIAVDNDINIYVDDRLNHRIQKFNKKGEFVEIVYNYPKDFQLTAGLVVDSDGHLFANFWAPDKLEVWEIWRHEVVHRYAAPAQTNITLGLDGQPWFSSGLPVKVSSGTPRGYSGDERTLQMERPLQNGWQLTISHEDKNLADIVLTGQAGRKIVIKFISSKDIEWLSPVKATATRIYFSITTRRDDFKILEVRFDTRSTRIATWTSCPGYDPLGGDGNYYCMKAEEADRLEFNLYKSAQILIDE